MGMLIYFLEFTVRIPVLGHTLFIPCKNHHGAMAMLHPGLMWSVTANMFKPSALVKFSPTHLELQLGIWILFTHCPLIWDHNHSWLNHEIMDACWIHHVRWFISTCLLVSGKFPILGETHQIFAYFASVFVAGSCLHTRVWWLAFARDCG